MNILVKKQHNIKCTGRKTILINVSKSKRRTRSAYVFLDYFLLPFKFKFKPLNVQQKCIYALILVH